jgi:UDP-GlcNAc:undecaprenyl-phosphate GlcNAc-1-phosphate transferase
MMSGAVRYPLSFAMPLLVAASLTPVAARLARRFGMLDHPSPNKVHGEPTPYLGGAAVAVSLIVVGAATAGASGELLVILLGAMGLGAWGLVDDWRTIRPASKLVIEVGAAVALWVVGVRAGLFGVAVLDLPLTAFWVVAIVNAINLLDNMDGLAAGVAAIAALAFAVAGGSLGFLLHNFPPAKVFLGDAGTLMLGFLLAALGLKLDMVGQSGFVRSAVPALILTVPLIDMAFVIVRRVRERRPFYSGGIDHSSHLLAGLGLSRGEVAIVTYAAEALGCGAALLLLYASDGIALGVFAASAVGSLATLLTLLHVAGADRSIVGSTGPPAQAIGAMEVAGDGLTQIERL